MKMNVNAKIKRFARWQIFLLQENSFFVKKILRLPVPAAFLV